MSILFGIWSFFATYVLQKAPYMVGFLTLLGYCLMGKKWYDTLAGTLKAIIGMLILNAGSGGLVSTFRPILTGLKDRFNLTACVIDPYYGQNAVTAGVEEVFGKGFSQAMTLLLIAFIVNILLVRFNRITKCRTLFTTGHVQVQQAATAYWLIMFALPQLLNNNVAMMVVMAVILGAYWAVGSNLTVKPMQELSEGAGFAIAHQQMFGIRLSYFLADKIFGTNGGKRKKEINKVGEIELPGFFSIFNENMVCTAILMTVFFGIIMVISLGTLMYMVEGHQPGTQFTDIPTSIYWAVVTMTTVGYGDIAPMTPIGRFLSALVMLLGYTIMAVPTGIVSAQFIHDHNVGRSRRRKCKECGAPLEDSAHYCPHCGVKVETSA